MLWLFTGIMTNNILCNFAHAVDETGQEHDHPYGHDHHHKSSTPLTEHNHKDKGNDHNHDSSTSCCINLTFNFFSVLQRDIRPTFKLNLNALSARLFLPVFINPIKESNVLKVVQDYTCPPPKIPDIRVYIQSFQI